MGNQCIVSIYLVTCSRIGCIPSKMHIVGVLNGGGQTCWSFYYIHRNSSSSGLAVAANSDSVSRCGVGGGRRRLNMGIIQSRDRTPCVSIATVSSRGIGSQGGTIAKWSDTRIGHRRDTQRIVNSGLCQN